VTHLLVSLDFNQLWLFIETDVDHVIETDVDHAALLFLKPVRPNVKIIRYHST
jgi:hypothetical protein